MSILSRGPSKDAFYQISVHLVSGLTGEDFLEINQSETRNASKNWIYFGQYWKYF
jgi:hypothetical protein